VEICGKIYEKEARERVAKEYASGSNHGMTR
jgi:hypothetical protein